MVLAHEWGHAIQKRTSLPSDHTIVVETQADCYAGAFTAWALHGNAPHFQITRPDLDRALSGFLLFSDPVGANAADEPVFRLPDSGLPGIVIAPDLSNLPRGATAVDPVTGTEVGPDEEQPR